jgi:hypothetical protein
MTIMDDWLTRKENARLYLLLLYRELRQVLESDLLPCEKDHLFSHTHVGEIRDRAWLVRPDLYTIGSHEFKGPSLRRASADSEMSIEESLREYLADLAVMLRYSQLKMELMEAVACVGDVMKMDLPIQVNGKRHLCPARKDHLAPLVPRLYAAFRAIRLEPSIAITSPDGGYFWDCETHQSWFESLTACAARA